MSNFPVIKAKRKLGQNFLVDNQVIETFISFVKPSQGETIIEIGPGRGALTDRLISTGARVIAIEFDRDLMPILTEK